MPPFIVGIGGAMDVAFIGSTAYVLVTLVGPDVGGSDIVGIYRVDGPDTCTVIADIGAFALASPPTTDFFVPTGVQYALDADRGGFLVDVAFGARPHSLCALPGCFHSWQSRGFTSQSEYRRARGGRPRRNVRNDLRAD